LSKAYLFPEKPARLPGFHTCVGGGGERQEPEWYTEKGISFLTDTKVTAVDVAAKKLTTASGDTLGYEKLIVATGARVRRPASVPALAPHQELVQALVRAESLATSEPLHKLTRLQLPILQPMTLVDFKTPGADLQVRTAGAPNRPAATAVQLSKGCWAGVVLLIPGTATLPALLVCRVCSI
jgi:hypothetical protein